MNRRIWFWLGIVTCVFVGVAVGDFLPNPFGIAVALILSSILIALFVKNALIELDAAPPTWGVPKFLGVLQTDDYLEPGYRLVPFRGLLFDVETEVLEKVNTDIPAQQVRTPEDNVGITVKPAITWTPGPPSDPKHIQLMGKAISTFIQSGRKAGVEDIIKDMVAGKLRAWVSDPEHEPRNFDEAVRSKEQAVAVILGEMSGINFVDYDKKGRATVNTHHADFIAKCKRGEGEVYLPSLGITINRFDIGEITIPEEVARAAEKKAIERKEAEAELIEIEEEISQAKKLAEELSKSTNTPVSVQEAHDIILKRKTLRDMTKSGGSTVIPSDLFGGMMGGGGNNRRRRR